MKKIKLTQGKSAMVDDGDFPELNKYKWHYDVTGYTRRNTLYENGQRGHITMHRQILSVPKGMYTDHIDGDKLNNQKSNLRICTQSENMRNKVKQKNNTSGYTGVSWCEPLKKWVVRIKFNKKYLHLGYFESKFCAAIMYNRAAIQFHGEFARLNNL